VADVYAQQQLEAQKNRMRNQNLIAGGGDHPAEGERREAPGMTRYARGGVAITIAAAPAEERSRSGSQPRYPYMDSEPFQGPSQHAGLDSSAGAAYPIERPGPHHRTNSSKYKRVPKELAGIGSTIKSKVDYDRRVYQERQRIQDSQQFQQDQMGAPPGDERGDPNRSGVQAQIFYKKDQSKVVYEEGQETYRGPEIVRQHQTNQA